MENTLGYELSNGGSIPSGRTKYVSLVLTAARQSPKLLVRVQILQGTPILG